MIDTVEFNALVKKLLGENNLKTLLSEIYKKPIPLPRTKILVKKTILSHWHIVPKYKLNHLLKLKE